ncbi:MAG: hypothetical protein N2644_01735 [Candidatus Sumerlaea chitinivorans]|nr:hypothetical protein [Candidatus Sumerlaea chitinivorans]
MLVIGLVAPAIARLPEEGLQRAQEAEKLVRSGDVDAAIRILVELDSRYPNEAAVQRRLAELYDGKGQLGAALYYYRRYLELAGNRARAEIRERVQTLERTAGAREAADEIARRLGKKARPQPTPETRTEQVIEKVLPDGRRVAVKSAEELMADSPKGATHATPTPTPRHPLAVREVTLPPEPPEAEPTKTNEANQALSPEPINAPPTATTASSPSPSVTASPTPKPVFTPPPIRATLSPADEALMLKGQNENPTESTSAATERSGVIPSKPTSPRAVPTQAETQSGKSVEAESLPHTGIRGTQVEVIRPEGRGDSPQAQKNPERLRFRNVNSDPYFTSEPGSGEKAKLTLSNEFADAVVTFVAVPAEGTEPINVILGIAESRSVEIEPGTYEVRISAMNNRYPPATVLRQQFNYTFEAGTTYHRRFSPGDTQRVP